MKELKEHTEELVKRFESIFAKVNPDQLQQKLLEEESKTLKSDFWNDVREAQVVMQQVSILRNRLEQINNLSLSLKNLKELTSLTSEEIQDLDIAKELQRVEIELKSIENELFLSGKFDEGNCFLSVHAGQGGVEAMDWAAMILRMYERLCEIKRWSVNIVDETKGEEAGIKSATVEIQGSFAYGLLKKESGTHRLVRQSPFNADALRQTSFALVEVLPVVKNSTEFVLNEAELEFDMFRSSGPGGQNVQKVSTAVRVKHIPTGITVSAQSERSQHQNKENALAILKAKLAQIEEERREKEEEKLKNWQKTASWGTQIRSYVLHPYKLVKDLRTQTETTDAEGVLNGNLEEFLEAEIRM